MKLFITTYFSVVLFFGIASVFSQVKKTAVPQMYSADINLGYNLARVSSNYYFEEQMPVSFQFNWHTANYYQQKKLNQYGFSDFGFTFLYHDFKQPELGQNFGLYGFMEFYLMPPKKGVQLSFRASQGLAYNTHPFDRNLNSKNKLFGSHWLFPFDIALYLKSPRLYKHWRLQLGLAIFHYSDGNLQSPNYGANIPSVTFGINYDLRPENILEKHNSPSFTKKWQYSILLRTGVNESDYYDSGIFPFYIPAFQVEKHLNYRHKLIFGTELFLSYFLKEKIKYEYYAVPEYNLPKMYDFKRIGIYAEHEFYYGKLGINLGVGYYVYYPYKFETRFYNRLGTKYYFTKNWTLMYDVKLHGINRAEAMEFGLIYTFTR